MKNCMYAVMLLLGLSMMVACGDNGQDKTEEKATEKTENQVKQEAVEEEAEPVDTRPRVYANAFDAFVNIREKPEAKAPILGVFRNGPEGAVLLGIEGEWTKIDCDGIVGYVLSKYVQDTPTVAYTGSATIDDIAGVYYKDGYGMYLWYDGTWESGSNNDDYYQVDPSLLENMGTIYASGQYSLQNNEVNLCPTCVDGRNDPADFIKQILPIDLAHHKLGEWEKEPFITKQVIEKWVNENREEYSYEIEEHGEAWLKDNAVRFMREGLGVFIPMTKEEFKKKGR